MTQRINKDSLPLNQPKRTPSHPTKSHIVKTKVDGKEKIIRFGEQGASTAGKPKEGESDRMTAKRDSFKARHAANIAKGPSSAAYWANKVKWADGGSVEVKEKSGALSALKKMLSLDSPSSMTSSETVADIAAGFIPGFGTAMSARDFERARRENDKLGMALSGLGMIPVFGGMTRVVGRAAKGSDELADVVKEHKMLQGVYRGYAGENLPAKTAFGTETYFVSPQKKVADYYAKRRSAETGADPHAEMMLVDPSTLRNNSYGLSIPIDKYNRDFLVTRARRVDPDEVKSRTSLYAAGGYVEYDPDYVDTLMSRTQQGFANGGLVNNEDNQYNENKIQSIMESLHKEMTNGY